MLVLIQNQLFLVYYLLILIDFEVLDPYAIFSSNGNEQFLAITDSKNSIIKVNITLTIIGSIPISRLNGVINFFKS